MTLSTGLLSSLPLSPVQTGMLFQSLWRPAAGFYVQQLQVCFRRTVDPELLRHSWNHLVARHDSLRACFVFGDQGNPRQWIAESAEVPFRFDDWSGVGAAAQKKRLDAYLREDRARAFAFDAAPLMRIALFRFGPDEFRMVWTSHHLLFDGRSRYVLLREFATTYQALEGGCTPDFAPAPAFRDFLRWMDGEDFSKAEGYWRTALAGVAEPTPIGFGAAVETHAGSDTRRRHVTRFPSTFLGRLERYAKEHGFTLNTLFQAAWAVVLSRYSRQEDVVIGAPRAGRNCPVPGVGSMVGVFVNTLPVRVRVDDSMPVLDFLRGLRENWVAMRPYEQTPLREIHGWCRLPEGQPLFDSLVGFESYQMAERLATDEPWWAGTSMALDGWTNFALTIQAYRGPGIELVLTYDPARFTAAAIIRLGGHLRTVLGSFLAPSTRVVGDLALLAPAERRQVLKDWNATATSFPATQDVASVFSQTARSTPAATALVLNDRRLSYRELDEASNAVAAWLQARGVGRGERVGVLLERSFEQVEAILGILKAGAAYVPLDSEYPRERLRFMIGDASLNLVLGDEENRDVLDGLAAGFETVVRARDAGRKAAGWRTLPADPDAAAYVVYTSGSTGTPKGVVVPHRGILRLVFGVDYVRLGPDRTLLQMAPVSFDASTFELWGALLHGARCVLYPHRRPQIMELARQLETHRVDTLWLTAALFNFVIDEAPEILRPVRQLLAGGEALSPAHVAKALACLPEVQLINGYGPTETTTFACCYPIPRDGFEADRAVPIGRPIGNTTVYVLDRRMRPVPVGAEGELFIGGAGVALGYLNRPELTAERFVRDPFVRTPASRLYRTGDLVSWRDDGLLEFRGRTDDQVKIRGFRIEPGEIARALQEHPAVKQAAVLAVEAAGGKELAAFYTTESEGDVTAANLRSFLSERLPGYMIPARFAVVASIPRTINGKVDRDALWRAGSTPVAPIRDRADPTTEIGRRLAALWDEILGVKGSAINESFFSVGGNSLSATRLIHQIERNFGVEIPFRVFFEAPTISSLEQLVRRRDTPVEEPSIATFQRHVHGDRWPAGEAQTSYVEFCFRPENLRRQYIVRAFRITGALNVASLVRSIRWVSRQNEALSTRFVIDAPGRIFQVRSEGECPVEILDLTGLPEEQRQPELQRILLDEQDHPFDPDAPWMHRFRVLVVSPREHVLICGFHHANFDGPSLNAFYRQLSESYGRFTAGKDANGSADLVQQSEVLDWLEQWMTPGRRAHSLNFWRTTLAGAPLMELPYAEPAGANRNEPGRIEYLTIDAPTVERLNLRARRHGVSLYQLFLAGFTALINRVGRNDDVLVTINVDLRTHGSFAEVIGSFPRRLMIRTTLEPDLHFSGVVGRVASRMSEALPHRYLPFDDIRKLCGSDVGHKSPLDRVFFVQSTEDTEHLALPDVICSQIPREHQRPRGMLSAGMREVSGRVELRAPHVPAFVPTESVRSMLALFEFIMTTIASGLDPRLSELPRLGEALVLKGPVPTTGARSDLERDILQMFRAILGTPEAGPLDSFFELGGNSLLATRFLHRADQSLGLAIPFHFLFANPTARSLAGTLATSNDTPTEPPIEAFRHEDRGDRWLLHPARANAVKFALQPENLRRRTVVRAFRLTGNLNRDTLVDSIRWVARRHEALSTHYVVEAGQVFQLRSAGECPVEIQDLTPLPEAERDQEVRRVVREEETRAFDPTAEWMHRYRVLMVAPHDHVLVMCFHHANFDGVSLHTYYRELMARYHAGVTGEPIDLPATVPQQTDVHDWLERWFDSERAARSRFFWRAALDGTPSLELPLAVDHPCADPGPGRIERLVVDAATVEKITCRAREHGVTLFQMFLAGLHLLINRVGRNNDIAIGIGVDLRTHQSLGDAIGCFVTRITIRTRLNDDPTIAEVVRRVASQMQEPLAHRYLPIDEVREACNSEDVFRNIGMVRFTHTGEFNGMPHLAEVSCSEIPRERAAHLGVLSIGMSERDGRVELPASHTPGILPTGTVRSMLQLYEYIMTVIASGLDPHLSELPRLGEAFAIGQRTTDANGRHPGVNANETGTGSVENTARAAPSAGTRVSEAQQREIEHSCLSQNRRNRNIVRAFRLEGDLKRDDLTRAIQWVVGRHEALHSRYVRDDAGGYFHQRNAEPPDVAYLDLHAVPPDQRMPAAMRIFAEESAADFDPDARWLHGFRLLSFEPRDHVFIARFHHLNFDGMSLVTFYRELSASYNAFATGREPELAPSPAQQSELLASLEARKSTAQHNIDCAFWRDQLARVPTIALPFAKRASESIGDVGRMESLSLDAALVARLEEIARHHGVTLYILFLAGLKVLLNRVTGQEDIPVGIATDRRGSLANELVIGNFSNMVIVRSDLRSAQSFSLLLRQVWTRTQAALAHRFLSSYELAEICPTPSDPLKNPLRMVRFIKAPDESMALDFSGLRLTAIRREHFYPGAILSIQMQHAGGRVLLQGSHVPGVLPAAVVQSMFALYHQIMRIVADGRDPALSAFPRWGEAAIRVVPDDAEKSAAQAETTVLALFRKTLHRPEAGPLDSFFELGGHSLLATLLLHRIEQSLGKSIPHHVLFENPTARKLAATLIAPGTPDQGPPRTALIKRPRNGRQRTNQYTKHEIGFLRNGRPRTITRSFLFRGPLQVDLLERALQWVTDRHDALRTRLCEAGAGEYDREVVPVRVRLSVVVIAAGARAEQMVEVEKHLAAEAIRQFTVDSFPFHAFTLLHLSDHEHVLVVNFHHIFFDGKSLPLFLGELSVAYAAYCRSAEPELPDPAFQLNDVMLWTEEWLEGGGFQSLDEYWKVKVCDLTPLRVPADLSPQPDGGVDGTILHRHLGATLTRQAREAAINLGTTFFGLNHGVANVLIHSYGNDSEAHAAIMCCMRRHPDAEGVLGNFANMVLVQTSLAGNPTFRELVGRTWRSAQDALAHRGFPFPLMRSLAPATTTCGGNPFRFYLTEEPALEDHFSLPGIEIESIPRRTFTPSPMLIFQIVSHPTDTTIRCLARPEYFSAKRREEIMDQYVSFLRRAVEDPERRLSEFPALEV